MNHVKIRNIVALLLNLATAVLVAIAVCGFFTAKGLQNGEGNMKVGGLSCFCFFTVDSNILAALCCLILIPFQLRALKSGKEELPQWALLLKLAGTAAVTVTLVVVLVFLGPILGYAEMFEGNCFWLHLICPLFAIFSLCFFEFGLPFTKKQALFGVIPTFLYGTVYLINVIFTKVWTDFYHFNIGGFWYISYLVMMAVTYLLALALCLLQNKLQKARKTK